MWFQKAKGMSLSLPSSEFPGGPLVLDASVLFNLLGTGMPKELLQALGVVCWVEERTAAEVRRMPRQRTESAPLQPLLDDGSLKVCRMSERAYETYLSLLSGPSTDTLDDGESAAIAIAVEGLGSVVLDDKKARRILAARFPRVASGTSLSLIIEAARRAAWSEEKLRDAVTVARDVSRMAVVLHERALFAELFAAATPR
jgi:predicted nucleic acid-binding protein